MSHLNQMQSRPLYFDHNATTPVHSRVLAAMQPYFSVNFGNSVSLSHPYGLEAEAACESSREKVANYLNCHKEEIYFTSGATESNNWAIEGLIESLLQNQPSTAKTPLHFLISPLEHNSVLQAAKRASRFFNVEVEFLKVNNFGQVDLLDLKQKIKSNTKMVAAMWVQNEIGSINPVQEIASLCEQHHIYYLSDATQAVGKVAVDLKQVKVDFLSFSAHKLGGPKGVGFLYIRKNSKLKLSPLICGGGHEKGLRSGTLNTPGIVGLAEAITIAHESGQKEQTRVAELRDRLWLGIKKAFPTARLNGHPIERSPNNLHVTFANCDLPTQWRGLAASQGSACLSGKSLKSHVLAALGFSETEMEQSLRLSLGHTTQVEDIDLGLQLLREQIKIRSVQPKTNMLI